MSAHAGGGQTRVWLSFSNAYVDFALRVGNNLRAANLSVCYDQWYGGGGVPAMQALAQGLTDAIFVAPLLTPSDAAPTWVGDEWRQTIYQAACARGIGVLPAWGAGDLSAVPECLRDRSCADLRGQDYAFELRRLIEALRRLSGDASITLPDDTHESGAAPAAMPLHAAPIILEVGAALAPLVIGADGTSKFIDEAVPLMYDGLFYEIGVQFPALRVREESDLPPASARVLINGVPETQVEVRLDAVMISESVGAMAARGIAAQAAINPANGFACAWIPAHQVAAVADLAPTTWDAQQFLILTLSALLRRKAADFIGVDEAQAMLTQLDEAFPRLVAETVPKTVSLFVLTDVLRRLVAERVSIGDLRKILMALAEWGRVERDPLLLTEYVRVALHRYITHKFTRGQNTLVALLLDPDIEREATRHTATGSYVDLEPGRLREILQAIREPMRAWPDGFQHPVILSAMDIRSCVRRLIAPSLPLLEVLSYQELRADTSIQPVGRISLAGFTARAGMSAGGVPLWPDIT
jgi:type III secretory pathway component EscV